MQKSEYTLVTRLHKENNHSHSLIYHGCFLVRGMKSEFTEKTHTRGEHVNSTKRSQEVNNNLLAKDISFNHILSLQIYIYCIKKVYYISSVSKINLFSEIDE